jgi:aspartyl-tRNA(Asn)/glutamyl-tRNA(Gln) amidotransferase subunit C
LITLKSRKYQRSPQLIDEKTIEHIAKLARLQISTGEAQEYSAQLSKALEYFQQIAKVDTSGVEPLVTPTEIEAFWREDKVEQEFTPEQMTGNAPSKAGNLFKVPPVV